MRGSVWSVLERSQYADCEALRLRPAHGETPPARTLLLPFDRPRPLPERARIRVVHARAWLGRLQAMTAGARPAGGFSTAPPGPLSILPYQLEAAILMRRDGTPRVMVADGVGLGKTIQAGLLLAELARRDGFRALVIVPAGLREQWTEELGARFGIETITATSPWLARAASDLPADVNPWGLPGVYLASFDLIKRPEVLRPLEDVTWDAVVVDEAHEASAGTARRAAIHAVACRARRVVLLTATPHAGDMSQFVALCRLGAHDEHSPPIVMFRRSRADVAPRAPRRTALIAIRLTSHERRMHRLLEAYTRRLGEEARARGDREARLVAIVLRKRALSSAASLAASCLRRLALLGHAIPAAAQEHQLLLPLGDEDPLADRAPDAVLGAPGLRDVTHERSLLAGIAEAARRASAGESKIRFLRRMFARLTEPAIVFTEYRDTLDRLRRELRRVRADLQVLHGGMDLRERAAAQAAFNTRSSLLIATDAAAEGLNLHARCRLVIHFELPWSPARLEQRTGRVDRIGQARRVHEVLLVANDTAERLVLAPLLARATRSRSSLPDAPALADVLTESQVAAALLEGTDPPAAGAPEEPAPFQSPPAHLRAEAVEEATRLMALRGCHTATRRPPPDGWGPHDLVAASLPRAPGLAPGIVAIFDITLATPDGTAAHRELAVAHCDAVYARPRTPSDLRNIAGRFRGEAETAVRTLLAHRCAGRLGRIAFRCRNAGAAAAARERAILGSLPSTATELVQAGLFDQRAIRASTVRSHASASLLEEAARRIDALASESHLSMSIRLRALLVVSGRP